MYYYIAIIEIHFYNISKILEAFLLENRKGG